VVHAPVTQTKCLMAQIKVKMYLMNLFIRQVANNLLWRCVE